MGTLVTYFVSTSTLLSNDSGWIRKFLIIIPKPNFLKLIFFSPLDFSYWSSLSAAAFCRIPETDRVATWRSGSGQSEMRTSRPRFSRSINPARSSNLRCFVTALSATSNGSAISRNRAGPFELGNHTFSLKHQTGAFFSDQQTSCGIEQIDGSAPISVHDKP